MNVPPRLLLDPPLLVRMYPPAAANMHVASARLLGNTYDWLRQGNHRARQINGGRAAREERGRGGSENTHRLGGVPAPGLTKATPLPVHQHPAGMEQGRRRRDATAILPRSYGIGDPYPGTALDLSDSSQRSWPEEAPVRPAGTSSNHSREH